MQKLTRNDLYSLEQYAEKRPDFRAQVLAHKQHRKVHIGPVATLYFEDRMTMQYQIQEMLRVERIFEASGIEEELGDMLFAMVNMCRFLGVNPENALNRTTNKFIKRFYYIQEKTDFDLSNKDIDFLESLWEEAKKA